MDEKKEYKQGISLAIEPLPTNKSKIKKTPLMEQGIIPNHPSSVIFSGRSGSGKSTLMMNLLYHKHFYNGYFDKVIVFSPTASKSNGSDDLYMNIDYIKEEHIINETKQEYIEMLLDHQKEVIEAKGIDKAPRLLIIMDDIQSHQKFLKSPEVLRCFIMCRHFNTSVWLCGQSWTKTPRACRLQANAVFMFQGSQSEHEKLTEEYCPPACNKKKFFNMIDIATTDPYSFLYINNKLPFKERFRKNLEFVIQY
jgi:hypothetical protein